MLKLKQVFGVFEEMLLTDYYIRDVVGNDRLELIKVLGNKNGEIQTTAVNDVVAEFSNQLQVFRFKVGYSPKEFISILEECIYHSEHEVKTAKKEAIKHALARIGFFSIKFIAFPLWNYFSRKERENKETLLFCRTLSKLFKTEVVAFNDTIRDIKESL